MYTPNISFAASRPCLGKADHPSSPPEGRISAICFYEPKSAPHEEPVVVIKGVHVLNDKCDEEGVGGGDDLSPVHELAVALGLLEALPLHLGYVHPCPGGARFTSVPEQ